MPEVYIKRFTCLVGQNRTIRSDSITLESGKYLKVQSSHRVALFSMLVGNHNKEPKSFYFYLNEEKTLGLELIIRVE